MDAQHEEPLLRIGPGARLDRAALLLEPLARGSAGAPRVSRWSDAAELLLCARRDRVVLDADHLPLEDIGIVRRFLVQRPDAWVEAVGSDRKAPAGRALLAFSRVRWHPWPLELSHLEDLLRGPPEAAAPTPPAPAAGAANGAEPRGFDWRAPLGDLALQVRRTGEAVLALRTQGELDAAASEGLASEILRLERAVRTLSLGAERPARAPEELDLDALVEQELAVLALQSRRAPRVRYQGGEPVFVRADRAVVVHALGVLLDLVRTLAGAGELVEVRTLQDAERRPPSRATVRLRAPAGALADVPPGELLQPAGLGERLPGIGPGELCALARLCSARGLALEARAAQGSPRELEFDLGLPLAERAAPALAGAPSRG